jgi:hypothetical protein
MKCINYKRVAWIEWRVHAFATGKDLARREIRDRSGRPGLRDCQGDAYAPGDIQSRNPGYELRCTRYELYARSTCLRLRGEVALAAGAVGVTAPSPLVGEGSA